MCLSTLTDSWIMAARNFIKADTFSSSPSITDSPECSQFIADNKARFLAGHENSIRRRLAEAKAQTKQPIMQGHDLTGMERFLPETRHMIVLDVKTSDSPVGFPGERHRYFLSDEGYKNARASEGRGEIRIKSHAAVAAGKLYPDRKPERER